jgi:hypothetical protein
MHKLSRLAARTPGPCLALLLLVLTAPGLAADAVAPGGAAGGASGGSTGGPAAGAAAASGLPGLPIEAPSSLFDLAYGDAEAEFLVKGSWKAGLAAQSGLVIDAAGGTRLSTALPLIFNQSPDLLLSFLLFKKLFVEARVSSDLSQTRYSIGYRGSEDEVLKEVRVGNDGISFPSLPFLSLGEGSYRSFGLGASLASGNFTGRAMLRYDQATRVERSFVGGAETTETVVSASDFIRGRFFALPSGAASLAVYVASTGGSLAGSDGLVYRALDGADFSLSSATGFLALAKTATTKVLAYYTGPGYPPGSTTIGLDGKTAVLLWDPEDRSKTALASASLVLSRYPFSSTDIADAFVRDRATGLRDPNYELRVDPSGFIEVSRGGVLSPSDPVYRQPFAQDMAWLYESDFSTTSVDTSYPPTLTRELVLRRYSASKTITVEKDIIDGSIEIRRNGLQDFAFDYDAATGNITLAIPPGLDEEIELSYLRENASKSSGSLAGGLAGLFDLGEGASAWTALGLRWSVPGRGYSEGGLSNPGSVVLSLGERDTRGSFRQSAALGASWRTGVAAGRYRLDGMEEGGNFASSYRALTGGSGFDVVAEAEGGLAKLFPKLMESLHSDGQTQKALSITAGTGGDLALVRYVEPPPFADLRRFSFFARLENAAPASAASLVISVDEGSEVAAKTEIRVTLPASALTPTWRRFVVSYGHGDSTVRVQAEEDGSLLALGAGASSAAELGLADARRIRIALTGASPGEVYQVDEILLEESAGEADLLLKATANYDYPGKGLVLGGYQLLGGLKLAGDLSASLSTSPYASGGASTSARIGPFDLALRARAGAADSLLSLRGGHELLFPAADSPITIRDSFDTDGSSGAFGRKDGLSIQAGWLGSLDLGQEASWTAPVGADPGVLDQVWTAKLAAAGGILGLEAKAASRALPKAFPGLEGDYFSRWKAAWLFFLPAYEEDFSRRELSLTATAGLGNGFELLRLGLSSLGEPLAGATRRSTTTLLRLKLPLRFGKSLSLEPYYQRGWTEVESQTGLGAGLFDFGRRLLVDTVGLSPLWEGRPLDELFSSAAFAGFSDFALASTSSSATYAPEFGLALTREFGSSWLDLLLPAGLSVSLKRQMTKDLDSLSDRGIIQVLAKYRALNLFGLLGAYPLLKLYETDEFSANYQATITEVAGEPRPRYTLILQHLASFYAKDTRDSLTADNRLSATREPSGSSWSDSLNLALSWLDDKSWLLALYASLRGSMAAKAEAPVAGAAAGAAPSAGAEKPRPSLASTYLLDLAKARPLARTSIGLTATLSSASTDLTAASLALSATEYLEYKLTIPQKLTLSLKPSLAQVRDATTRVLNLGASLALSATISF